MITSIKLCNTERERERQQTCVSYFMSYFIFEYNYIDKGEENSNILMNRAYILMNEFSSLR